jgi:hypothetical protein
MGENNNNNFQTSFIYLFIVWIGLCVVYDHDDDDDAAILCFTFFGGTTHKKKFQFKYQSHDHLF